MGRVLFGNLLMGLSVAAHDYCRAMYYVANGGSTALTIDM